MTKGNEGMNGDSHRGQEREERRKERCLGTLSYQQMPRNRTSLQLKNNKNKKHKKKTFFRGKTTNCGLVSFFFREIQIKKI